MRPSTTRSSERAALVLAVLVAGAAQAQACCAGVSLLTPLRLTPHEDAAVGLQVAAGLEVGSLDARGRFLGNPAGAGGVDLTQVLVGSLRVLKEGQLSLTVPAVETVRWVPAAREAGGGLGDVGLSFRYDFVLAGESVRVPGLALLAGVLFPTGRAAEQAVRPLGSDATGAGLWQAALGLGVEQSWGHVFLQGSVVVLQGLPRRVGTVTETLGPTFTAGLGGGWVFDSGAALGLVLSGSASTPAWIDGVSTDGTARARATVGVSAAWPFSDAWRVQGSLVSALPLGRNELVATTLSVLLLRTWS